MEKEPRQKRRGLDSETLSTLKTTGLEDLPTTTSAHTAKEAVNLLILAVMRLERALQRVHPLTIRQGKHTRDYTPGNSNPSRQCSPPVDGFATGPSPGYLSPHRQKQWGHLAAPISARVSRGFRAPFI